MKLSLMMCLWEKMWVVVGLALLLFAASECNSIDWTKYGWQININATSCAHMYSGANCMFVIFLFSVSCYCREVSYRLTRVVSRQLIAYLHASVLAIVLLLVCV